MSQSNQLYKDILQNIESDITDTFQIPIPPKAIELTQKCERIFITGSGSSYPAAYFIAKYLNKHTRKNVILAGSSDILDSQSINSSDLVILVSQGWSRADGYLITKKCIEMNANMVVFTGHPERIETHYPEADVNKIAAIEIKPNKEKIFCRPNSPVTSLIQTCRLFDISLDEAKVKDILEQIKSIDLSEYIKKILKHDNIIVLSSSTSIAACYNTALALREGAGKHTSVYEIENYGHGWYTYDQDYRDKTLYILVSHSDHKHSLSAYKRIESLIKNTSSNYLEIYSNLDEVYGNIYTLIFTAFIIPKLNDITDFDMNNPQGMEENRGFHEIFEQTQSNN
jgi:fructoselysine-6-P-deglycase FrlB-like protein